MAADRLPDPRAGKERACKCGKMLVSNVIEVGFPCPFCGDKGGPVSAAVSPAEPPAAFLHFDGMAWPNPNDPRGVQWRLRYGVPTREDILIAASMCNAYAQLVSDPTRRRNEKIAGIRKAMSEADRGR